MVSIIQILRHTAKDSMIIYYYTLIIVGFLFIINVIKHINIELSFFVCQQTIIFQTFIFKPFLNFRILDNFVFNYVQKFEIILAIILNILIKFIQKLLLIFFILILIFVMLLRR